MKKNLLLALLIAFMFSNTAIAEETPLNCYEQATVCLEKCTGKNAEDCEDTCYEKQELCFEEDDK